MEASAPDTSPFLQCSNVASCLFSRAGVLGVVDVGVDGDVVGACYQCLHLVAVV